MSPYLLRPSSVPTDQARLRAVTRGRWLTWATVAYNSLEGLLSVGAGALAGSIALVGFGIDSFLELAASLAAIWRLGHEMNPDRREKAERRARRLIGFSLAGLAVYIGYESTVALVRREQPAESVIGIGIAMVSLIVMPLLARAKRRVAAELRSGALRAEARQTEICTVLSALLLGGLVLHAVAGWWWADPLAALAMTPWIAWEGIEGLRGRETCESCAPLDAAGEGD